MNKDQQEDMIEDALEEFAFAFPRLQMLKKTYVSLRVRLFGDLLELYMQK